MASDTVKGTSNLDPGKAGEKPLPGLDEEAFDFTSEGRKNADKDDNPSKSSWLDDQQKSGAPKSQG